MKKWFFLAGLLGVVVLAAVVLAIWISRPSELPEATGNEDLCTRFGLTLDRSSIDRIYSEPASILEDPALFWTLDAAYSLVATAPQYWGQTIPPEDWVRNIERLNDLTETEREDKAAYARSLEIAEHWGIFCQHALPVIASLLPEDVDLSTTVYLSAFTDPANFVYRSNVIMNAHVPSYFGKTSKFFNLLGHELFHIGFWDSQPYQTEVWTDDYPTMVVITTLQNEGLAVYTQYLLDPIYPAPAEIELLLLDSNLAVNWLMDRVNALLQDAEAVSETEIMSAVYEGLNQRALYVVGAYMAKTIDENLGREALAETVDTGPRAFITTYNSVADAGWEIHEIPEPVELSPIQLLRQAALQGDLEGVESAIPAIENVEIEGLGGAVFEHLMSTGLLLLEEDQAELAVEVFQLMVSLFPEHPYSYLNLGDAYSQLGDLASAEAAYRQALEIDPRLAAAIDR